VAACCPRPLPRGRLPPVARGPCPVVGCRLLPKAPASGRFRLLPEAPAQWQVAACCPRPLPSGRLPPVARGPCPVVGCAPVARGPCPVVGCRLLPEPQA
ncbi:unnamed protein product, partial [Staurois parvus]